MSERPAARVRSESPILLIVDDRDDATLVRECLAEAGLDAAGSVWARTLAEGLRAVSDSPRCVLLALDLPDADGLSALFGLADVAPEVPVIVLTGSREQAGVEALAAGAEDYLIKDDITPDLLGRSIRYAVERKRAQRTGLQLREARLSSAEKARLERGLLPTPLLRTDAVDCATYYQPGRDHAVLGGDFFDVVESPDGRIRAIVGDVMGHGPEEAALGVHLRVAWRTLILAGAPDDQILPALQTLLAAESGGQTVFVTVCDVTIDAMQDAYIRVAGHPAPLLCARGVTRYLDVAVGPPLGIDPPGAALANDNEGKWPQTRVRVGPGSSLVLYTDGLLDAYAGDSSLGIDEMVSAVSTIATTGSGAGTWIALMIAGAPNESVDDSAIVVLTTHPPDEG